VVFGHAGRFSPVKNHRFLLEVAAYIVTQEPKAKFLLVGDGPLRQEVELQAKALGLKDKIVFAGMRSDIPRLMMGAMDVFLLPSIHEGLPLVTMETQAAGLPCVASEALTDEAIVNPALVRRLPLSAGPGEWARIACETAKQPAFDRHQAVEILNGGRFDVRRGIQEMCDIYLEQASATRIQPPAARKLAAGKGD
jgi:glycosyltransferase involved in cell wall biosynthesis